LPVCSEIEVFLLPSSGSNIGGITCEWDVEENKDTGIMNKKYPMAINDLMKGIGRMNRFQI
jgi:hypothetical protein